MVYYGRLSATDQYCADTWQSLKDQTGSTNNMDGWREKGRESVCACVYERERESGYSVLPVKSNGEDDDDDDDDDDDFYIDI